MSEDTSSARAIPARSRPTPITGAGSPSSASFRRSGRSVNENGAGAAASVDDSNWRARGMSVEKDSSRRGPERTVGGFELSEVRSGASALSTSKGKGDKTALSHVPCRFYKAGACTAGSACPFSHDGECCLGLADDSRREEGDLPVVPQGRLQVWTQM